MTTGQSGFLLMLFAALVLITMGFYGTLGVAVGILFCPRYVTLDD